MQTKGKQASVEANVCNILMEELIKSIRQIVLDAIRSTTNEIKNITGFFTESALETLTGQMKDEHSFDRYLIASKRTRLLPSMSLLPSAQDSSAQALSSLVYSF